MSSLNRISRFQSATRCPPVTNHPEGFYPMGGGSL